MRLLPAASASTRVVLSRCVHSCHMWLGSSSSHASTAAITFHAVCPAVSAHARITTAIVPGCTLDATIAANHSVIAIVSAIRTTISPAAAVSVRHCSVRMLNATIAADHSVISIVSAVWTTISPFAAVSVRCSIGMLNAAIPAN